MLSDKDSKKAPLVVVAGPTAVGKSEVALLLAQKFDGTILSGDSMQVYKGMDIGTAKPSPSERRAVPHELIDIRDPKDPWNVVLFQNAAEEAFLRIEKAGRLPILTGGTGFYMDAFVYGTTFLPEEDPEKKTAVEERLRVLEEKEGEAGLHRLLEELDPASAKAIHPHNTRRVKRALRAMLLFGVSLSEHNAKERKKEPVRPTLTFVLTMKDRSLLYERIDYRVDKMMEQGLLEEVRRLKEAGLSGKDTAMQAIGYRELLRVLEGESTLPEAVSEIKKNTRHYAKRQLTWFLHHEDAIILSRKEGESAAETAKKMEEPVHAFLGIL